MTEIQLDVREIPPRDRHPRIFQTFDSLAEDVCSRKAPFLVLLRRHQLDAFPLIAAYMDRKNKTDPCFNLLYLDIPAQGLFGDAEHVEHGHHWTAQGHSFVADRIFELLGRKIIPSKIKGG